MDFTHSSRKSWTVLRKLGAASTTKKDRPLDVNQVARAIHKTSNIKPDARQKCSIRDRIWDELKNCEVSSALAGEVTVEEILSAVKHIKGGKAAGADDILPVFLMHLGGRAVLWIAKFFSQVIDMGKLPKSWKDA
jgi:hypothetical protein